MKPTPPKSALRFLRWFCREDYLEEIEGDLTELYEKHCNQSPAKANWKFIWSVIRYFRPEFIKSFKTNYHPNTLTMFRHSFLLSYRNFMRYKSTFFINTIGLSTGLAATLLIYLWVHDELSIDKFHEKDRQLFQVLHNHHRDTGIHTSEATPGILAKTLAEEMPEIEYAAAIVPSYDKNNGIISVGNTHIRTSGQFVSKDYFNIFPCDFIQGDKNRVLADKNEILISDELALTLFHTTENAMGKIVELNWKREEFNGLYFVSGVFKQPPSNSSMQFDLILSYDLYQDKYPQVEKWWNGTSNTYIILEEGTNVDEFNDKIEGFIKSKYEKSRWTLFVQRYSERYLYGNYENGIPAGGRITYVKLFSIIALFILLIACINFMNLSTARASRRIKEIGIKKAIGVHRKTIALQFLGESLFMSLLSSLLSILLIALFLPQFNEITGKQLTLDLDINLILSILGITFLTGIISGSYPAWYLSRFSPVVVLKGRLNVLTGELWTRKGLIIFQFAVSLMLILAVIVVYEQMAFIQSKNLGYNRDNIIYFENEGKVSESLETFISRVKNIPGVVNVSSLRGGVPVGHGTAWGFFWEGQHSSLDEIEFGVLSVGYDFIETLDIAIAEGRPFSRDFNSESSKIIFNEAAIKAMGLSDPIGKTVNFWGEKEIIGVVKNFHFESLHDQVKPLFFQLNDNPHNILVKIKAGTERETIARLQKFYKQYNSGLTLNFKFLDEAYQTLYVAEQRVATLSKYFAGIAILISCLGLFGLASFTAERRIKEIGIRKILGSSEFGIVRLLSNDFTKIVVTATLVAMPVSYFIGVKWLESFAYRIDLKWWYFMGAGLTTLLIAWLIVGTQTIKAARINPAQCLKDE